MNKKVNLTDELIKFNAIVFFILISISANSYGKDWVDKNFEEQRIENCKSASSSYSCFKIYHTDTSNLDSNLNTETVSSDTWVDSYMGDIFLERYMKLHKSHRNLIPFEDFKSLEIEKLRKEFFIFNSGGLDKKESMLLYVKLFNFGSIENLISIKSSLNTPIELFRANSIVNNSGNLNDFIFLLKKENNKIESFYKILKNYKKYNYASKINANVAIGKILRNEIITLKLLQDILRKSPSKYSLDIEDVASYYSIFSRIELSSNQIKLIDAISLSIEDPLIRAIARKNAKLNISNKTIEEIKHIREYDLNYDYFTGSSNVRGFLGI